MLKTLREDGFKVTCYERRQRVSGLWAYTDDLSMTSALPSTRALISKYACGMTGFPVPDKYQSHLPTAGFQEYIDLNVKHFDLHRDIVFGASLQRATRTKGDTKWNLEMLVGGEQESHQFDKVVFCHGYQTRSVIPVFEGAKFEGQLMHGQQFKSPKGLEGKHFGVVGVSSSAYQLYSAGCIDCVHVFPSPSHPQRAKAASQARPPDFQRPQHVDHAEHPHNPWTLAPASCPTGRNGSAC